MGIETAWRHTTGGAVIVAVVDSGIDLSHPDLVANLWANPGEIQGNRIDDDRDGLIDDVHGIDLIHRDGDPADDNGHGTHVAGIIGAVGANGIGAAGVAWHVQLMAVKVLDADGSGTTDNVARGIVWAIAHGARVINISLEGAAASSDLEDAILLGQRAGVLFVAAVGNDGSDLVGRPSYPASYPETNVIGVAASRRGGLLTLFSNFGTGMDLAAPGQDIFATALGGGYELRSGTSMAAPMVAGAAALLLAAAPSADAVDLVRVLRDTARPATLLIPARRLDVGRALDALTGLVAPAAPAAIAAPARETSRHTRSRPMHRLTVRGTPVD